MVLSNGISREVADGIASRICVLIGMVIPVLIGQRKRQDPLMNNRRRRRGRKAGAQGAKATPGVMHLTPGVLPTEAVSRNTPTCEKVEVAETSELPQKKEPKRRQSKLEAAKEWLKDLLP